MEQKPQKPLKKPARALLQSLLVAGYVLLCFSLVSRLLSQLALASLAASAFIAFGFPNAESARTRYLLGGYACGAACGALAGAAAHALPGYAAFSAGTIACCAVAVFATAFLMFLFNLQHPPAAALAAGMVLVQHPFAMALAMLGCILGLCGLRWAVLKLFGRYFLSS